MRQIHVEVERCYTIDYCNFNRQRRAGIRARSPRYHVSRGRKKKSVKKIPKFRAKRNLLEFRQSRIPIEFLIMNTAMLTLLMRSVCCDQKH